MEDNQMKWEMISYDTFVEVKPYHDAKEHGFGDECWCKPTTETRQNALPLVTHNQSNNVKTSCLRCGKWHDERETCDDTQSKLDILQIWELVKERQGRSTRVIAEDIMQLITKQSNQERIETVQIVDSLLTQEHLPLHIAQADILKKYIRTLEVTQTEIK